ncbi:hypothetical protein SDC9_183200 [bioreactor metagenome]|uniref:Uncharacterized protein n=1 Tax=bioreactor metagenome TaxID=1076179 RepID=A0A645HBG0_9ZZZZ
MAVPVNIVQDILNIIFPVFLIVHEVIENFVDDLHNFDLQIVTVFIGRHKLLVVLHAQRAFDIVAAGIHRDNVQLFHKMLDLVLDRHQVVAIVVIE